ncbi:response regulator transcription factor [Kitasatospora sp. NPDC052896]|uniref:response regulator transcription factor n=1 Tax=Kitasatospora sp. NPDC052896 TaxID=3364061 RepID=UPI0037CADDC6
MSFETPPPPAFSPREREILTHLAEGATYQVIAHRLGISPHTVDTYARRLRDKSGAANRVQLALLAVRLGCAVPPHPFAPRDARPPHRAEGDHDGRFEHQTPAPEARRWSGGRDAAGGVGG